VRVPRDPGPVRDLPSVAPITGQQLNKDRGRVLVDRLVTIRGPKADFGSFSHGGAGASDDWWEARFVSDNTLQDQPIRLLPCKLLQVAESLHARQRWGGDTARFRVSGLITNYKGKQYLLLRKVVVERDMGQF